MAINWTEAQIEEIVKAVVANVKPSAPRADTAWSSTAYAGRQLIGIYETMEEAIEAAEGGYHAVRAMSVAEREKLITKIRDLQNQVMT